MRSNLAAVILRAKALRLGDVREFPFVQAPPPKAFADGFAILQEFGAISEDNELTEVGRSLSRLPIDPKLGRMLLEGARRGALRELFDCRFGAVGAGSARTPSRAAAGRR